MSRALGAAFLNHQVEQLEKSVSNGPGPGNWRTRRQAQAGYNHLTDTHNNTKRPPHPTAVGHGRKKSIEVAEQDVVESRQGRKSGEESRIEKDADIVVVDASVLVHALYQVKKWCREGRQERVIVPLEGLCRPVIVA
jgi:hypothetical protein